METVHDHQSLLLLNDMQLPPLLQSIKIRRGRGAGSLLGRLLLVWLVSQVVERLEPP